MRPLAVAMCDLDAVFLSGAIPIAEPFPLGHECVAEVIEVGDAVRGVKAGRRRRRAVPDLVRDVRRVHGRPHRELPDGPARFGVRHAAARRRLGRRAGRRRCGSRSPTRCSCRPSSIRWRSRASPTTSPDGYRAVARRGAAPAQEVLVVGGFARSVGLYAVACAKALGAARVVYADTDEGRLERAAALGAETVAGAARSSGASRSRSTPPAATPACTPRCARPPPDGVCTSVAIYFEPTTPLPLLEMYTRGCTLHTSRCHARALIPEVLALIADGRLDPGARDERGRGLRRRGVRARGPADEAGA